jgi:hypothetical protein
MNFFKIAFFLCVKLKKILKLVKFGTVFIQMFEKIEIDKKILELHFACDLKECKGACCNVYGGSGAPLLEEEIPLIENNLEIVKQYLSEVPTNYINKKGFWEIDEDGTPSTVCINKRDCVFVYYDNDVAKCAIEKAFFDGKISFRKPISCHLFPIRIRDNKLVYEEFAVCDSALKKGKEENIALVKFLKEALIRKFNENIYSEIEKLIEKT